MAGLNLFTNNAATTLASAVLIGATSLTVATGTGALFPTLTGSQYFYCTLTNNAGSIEIIKVTARSTDTFTIVRGQDGTSAAAWSAGDKVELRLTRIDLLNFPQLDSTNTFATTQTFTAAPVFTDQSGTRTAMSAAASGANSDITSLSGLTTALSVAQGGTGNTTYTNGQLLIGNTTGNTLTKSTLTAGSNVTITNSTGSITIAAAGGMSTMQVFTTPGTFTTPATTTRIRLTVVGGGGGGAPSGANPGFPSPSPFVGSSGGGGGAAQGYYTVTVSTPYAVTVGPAGTDAGGPGNGTAGGTSSFGALASATGGGAGGASIPTGGTGGTGTGGNGNYPGLPGIPGATSTSRRGSSGLGTIYGTGGNSTTQTAVAGVVIVEY